ncbi:hypothetical protein ACWCP6_16750 [Streptomyces sp. NPDC002004]
MDAELTALATAGATALVERMVGDGWTAVRDRVAAFFVRRRGGDEEAAQGELETARGELDVARDELVAARDADDAATAEDLEREWRSRLRRALRADPAAAEELRALLDELAGDQPDRGRDGGAVSNVISGGVQHAVVQAHTMRDLNFGESRGGS